MNQEILIIGGGVIGLSLARELHRRGMRSITIVDRGRIGAEASWAAAGMLAPNIETDTDTDFHRFGIESLEIYPELSDALREETGIDIELDRSGTLCVAFDDTEAGELAHTFRRQQDRGVTLEHLSSDAIGTAEPSISNAACAALFYPNDWQVENRKLISALQAYSELRGITLVENAEVLQLMANGGRITGARTESGEYKADVTVVATGAWTSLIKIGELETPFSVTPIRGQMIAIDACERTIQRVVYSPRGYIVPRSDGRVLVGATVEDVGFDKDNTLEGVTTLRDAAIEIVPGLSEFAITEQWAGLRPFAADGLPILGQFPGYDNAFVATAHYRNGILLAPRTAQIIADRIIDGFESEFLNLFRPGRFGSSNADAAARS